MSLPATTPRYQIGGFDVALAARLAGSSRVLAVYIDRGGRPTDRYREVEAHELRRIGTHLAEIKAAIAALPELRLPWDAAGDVSQETFRAQRAHDNGRRHADSPVRSPAEATPVRGRLFAHNAIPPGDE